MNIELKELAKTIGIDVVGVTNGAPLLDGKRALEKRKQHGGFCSFEETDIGKRTEPKRMNPAVKSIVVFGCNYYYPDTQIPSYGEGKLALISRGLDYHKVLHNRGLKLAKEMGIQGKSQVLVDTHPLMERELAKRAGLGYFGKSCQLIHPEFGSYLVLGLILSEVELENSTNEIIGDCGDCNKCIDACPGKALRPYELYPNQCISYLTQKKEELSSLEEERMGIQLYGCDMCQKMCPKNKNVPITLHEEFFPNVEVVSIERLQKMSNREFKEAFGFLSGAWRGKKTWQRNGKIVMENWRRLVNKNKNML